MLQPCLYPTPSGPVHPSVVLGFEQPAGVLKRAHQLFLFLCCFLEAGTVDEPCPERFPPLVNSESSGQTLQSCGGDTRGSVVVGLWPGCNSGPVDDVPLGTVLFVSEGQLLPG